MNRYGEAFAPFYDRYFGHYAEKAAPLFLRFFSRQKAAPGRSRVLDLGCGTGRVALHFLQTGFDFTGLDRSPDMLALARARCLVFLRDGRARFLAADISGFDLPGPFDLVLSTYNTMNHLDSEERLRGCFRSVRRCLAPGSFFLFDYHTLKGLRQWACMEFLDLEGREVSLRGSFDAATGRALAHLKGDFADRPFEERVLNWSLPLEGLRSLLRSEGFTRVVFSRIDDLNSALTDPEGEDRVVAVAV